VNIATTPPHHFASSAPSFTPGSVNAVHERIPAEPVKSPPTERPTRADPRDEREHERDAQHGQQQHATIGARAAAHELGEREESRRVRRRPVGEQPERQSAGREPRPTRAAARAATEPTEQHHEHAEHDERPLWIDVTAVDRGDRQATADRGRDVRTDAAQQPPREYEQQQRHTDARDPERQLRRALALAERGERESDHDRRQRRMVDVGNARRDVIRRAHVARHTPRREVRHSAVREEAVANVIAPRERVACRIVREEAEAERLGHGHPRRPRAVADAHAQHQPSQQSEWAGQRRGGSCVHPFTTAAARAAPPSPIDRTRSPAVAA
jgi:hypothetical protein